MNSTQVAIENQPKNMFRLLLSYIIPGIAGLLFNSLYIVVDGLFVARMLGREPLAAVTVGVPVVEILLSLSMLISVGAGVLISSKSGRGEHAEARNIFNMSVRLLAIVAMVIAVVSLTFRYPIAKMLGATPDIIDLVVEYLTYFFAFSPFFMFSYAMCTWLRNDSQPKLAMFAQNMAKILELSLWIAVAIGITAYFLLFRYSEIPVSIFADNDLELVKLLQMQQCIISLLYLYQA